VRRLKPAPEPYLMAAESSGPRSSAPTFEVADAILAIDHGDERP
jgi:beta-phosphoglucomutase-like phosphatase (HAD superfamily)